MERMIKKRSFPSNECSIINSISTYIICLYETILYYFRVDVVSRRLTAFKHNFVKQHSLIDQQYGVKCSNWQ